MVSLLFALATRCEKKVDLERVDSNILFYLQESGLHDKNERMVHLVWHVQRVAGDEKALDLAKKFRLYKTLVNIAY